MNEPKPNQDDERLSAFIDGELRDDELAQFEALMTAHPEYRQLAEELRDVGERLKQLPSHQLSENLTQRILRQAERESLQTTDTTVTANDAPAVADLDPRPRRGIRRGLVWAAAAVAAAVVVGVFQSAEQEVAFHQKGAVEPSEGTTPSDKPIQPETSLARSIALDNAEFGSDADAELVALPAESHADSTGIVFNPAEIGGRDVSPEGSIATEPKSGEDDSETQLRKVDQPTRVADRGLLRGDIASRTKQLSHEHAAIASISKSNRPDTNASSDVVAESLKRSVVPTEFAMVVQIALLHGQSIEPTLARHGILMEDEPGGGGLIDGEQIDSLNVPEKPSVPPTAAPRGTRQSAVDLIVVRATLAQIDGMMADLRHQAAAVVQSRFNHLSPNYGISSPESQDSVRDRTAAKAASPTVVTSRPKDQTGDEASAVSLERGTPTIQDEDLLHAGRARRLQSVDQPLVPRTPGDSSGRFSRRSGRGEKIAGGSDSNEIESFRDKEPLADVNGDEIISALLVVQYSGETDSSAVSDTAVKVKDPPADSSE